MNPFAVKRKQDVSDDASVLKKQKWDPESLTDLSALKSLLDFTSRTTASGILNQFDLLARALLHDFYLVVRCGTVETQFEILELEFYLQKVGCHEDPFTHGSEEQKVGGRWYFHRAPKRTRDSHRNETSLTGYRGGTRKGLDLTIGRAPTLPSSTASPHFPSSSSPAAADSTTLNDTSNQVLLRGGALLRSVRRLSDSKVISGPSLLVDEILFASDASTIDELVSNKWAGNTSAFSAKEHESPGTYLFLKPRSLTSCGKPTIYQSPRIGIELSHPGTTTLPDHPRVIFLPRQYRYFVHPELLTANGRPHTFLGVLRACLNARMTLSSANLKAELTRVTGLKDATVTKYLSDYQGGLSSGSLKAYVGSAGRGASSSPSTYLRMMGILERLRNTRVES